MYTTTEVSAGSEPISFQQFQENISKQMGIPIGSFELRYKDDEGDVIAISSDMELQEAVRQASTRTPAVIEVIVETQQTTVEKVAEKQVEEKEKAAKVQEHEEQISTPEGISEIILHQAVCSNCQFPIVGVRFKCAVCPHFDLCEICEMMDNSHPVDHPLIKAKRPLSPEFNRIFNLSYGLHNGIHKASDGFQQIGTSVQQYGTYIGTNVHQYGSQVGSQIKQTWTEHQPQIDAARQRAYEKWTEVKEQVKVISDNMKVKAKEFSETLKKESNEWFKEGETTYPGNAAPAPTTSAVPTPAPVASSPIPIPTPMPAPVLASSSSPALSTSPPTKEDPLQVSRQSPPASVSVHPSAPATPTQFQQQLATLASMGFTDVNRNVTLLSRYGGDVGSCVQALLDTV